MELIKVLIIGIVVSVIAMFLKSIKPEYSLLCVIVGSIIIILCMLNSLTTVFSFFENVIEKTGISYDLFLTMLKIIGIGYLVEFSANVCRDSGNASIADKVILAGKLMIFIISLPIINNLFNMVLDLVK